MPAPPLLPWAIGTALGMHACVEGDAMRCDAMRAGRSALIEHGPRRKGGSGWVEGGWRVRQTTHAAGFGDMGAGMKSRRTDGKKVRCNARQCNACVMDGSRASVRVCTCACPAPAGRREHHRLVTASDAVATSEQTHKRGAQLLRGAAHARCQTCFGGCAAARGSGVGSGGDAMVPQETLSLDDSIPLA